MNREKIIRVRMIKTSDMTPEKELGYQLGDVYWDKLEGFRELWNRTDTDTKDEIVLKVGKLAMQQASNDKQPRANKKALRLFGVVRWFLDRKRKILFGTAAILLFAFGFGNDIGWYDDAACFLGGLAIGYS